MQTNASPTGRISEIELFLLPTFKQKRHTNHNQKNGAFFYDKLGWHQQLLFMSIFPLLPPKKKKKKNRRNSVSPLGQNAPAGGWRIVLRGQEQTFQMWRLSRFQPSCEAGLASELVPLLRSLFQIPII